MARREPLGYDRNRNAYWIFDNDYAKILVQKMLPDFTDAWVSIETYDEVEALAKSLRKEGVREQRLFETLKGMEDKLKTAMESPARTRYTGAQGTVNTKERLRAVLTSAQTLAARFLETDQGKVNKRCDRCQEVLSKGDMHCKLCHVTFAKGDITAAVFRGHVKQCISEARVAKRNTPCPLAPELLLIKAALQDFDAAVNPQAFFAEWDFGRRTSWTDNVKMAETTFQLEELTMELVTMVKPSLLKPFWVEWPELVKFKNNKPWRLQKKLPAHLSIAGAAIMAAAANLAEGAENAVDVDAAGAADVGAEAEAEAASAEGGEEGGEEDCKEVKTTKPPMAFIMSEEGLVLTSLDVAGAKSGMTAADATDMALAIPLKPLRSSEEEDADADAGNVADNAAHEGAEVLAEVGTTKVEVGEVGGEVAGGTNLVAVPGETPTTAPAAAADPVATPPTTAPLANLLVPDVIPYNHKCSAIWQDWIPDNNETNARCLLWIYAIDECLPYGLTDDQKAELAAAKAATAAVAAAEKAEKAEKVAAAAAKRKRKGSGSGARGTKGTGKKRGPYKKKSKYHDSDASQDMSEGYAFAEEDAVSVSSAIDRDS